MNMGGAGGRRRISMALPPAAKDGGKGREDDLALFREMLRRDREKNVSLLQPVSDEFESNNGIYPLYKIPSRKKGTGYELLPVEGEKNDYDWLKTPPATPLFPSLEMEANNPNLIMQREIPFFQPPRPSRFAGKMEETKPSSRQKSPLPKSTVSPRTSTPTATANFSESEEVNYRGTSIPKERARRFVPSHGGTPSSAPTTKPRSRGVSPSVRSRTPAASVPAGFPHEPPPHLVTAPAAEPKRGGGGGGGRGGRQSCSPGAARGRGGAVAQKGGEHDVGAINGRMLVGNLAFGSRMVEKVMTARRSAAAAGGRGGGEVKDLKPKQGAPTKQAYGRPSSHSTQAMTTKNMGIRIKPANRHQKQNEGHLESNASSSGSTPRTAPGYEGKEGRNLLIKKGVVRHSWMMC